VHSYNTRDCEDGTTDLKSLTVWSSSILRVSLNVETADFPRQDRCPFLGERVMDTHRKLVTIGEDILSFWA